MKYLERAVSTTLVLLMLLWLVDVYWLAELKPTKLENIDVPEITVKESLSELATITLPPTPATNTVVPATNNVIPATNNVVPVKTGTSKTTEQNLSLLMQNLAQLDGKSLRIYFPKNKAKRNRIIEHLYHCEGAAFASIASFNSQQVSLLYHPKKKGKKNVDLADFSPWLRAVNQGLTQQEANLMLAYSDGEIPVRLFPKHLDHVLSAHINRSTDSATLSQFSAKYHLTSQSLSLTDIAVNGREIDEIWLLSEKQCV